MTDARHPEPPRRLRESLLDEDEIRRIEQDHADGVTAQEVVEIFSSRGVKLSEATFRKYVQLGLLPRSRRVRREGLRRGSLGIYPVSVVARIAEIKELMAQEVTVDEIREKFLSASSEIDELEQCVSRVFERLAQTLEQRAATGENTDLLRRELEEAKGTALRLMTVLRRLEGRFEARARLERTAV